MRRIGAAVLAIVALALLAAGVPSTFRAVGARRAVVSSCDYSLAALPSGTWVRLRGCGVDMFHASFLDDAGGTRSHRLAPLRAPGGDAEEPSSLALAIPAAWASDANVFKNTPRPDSADSQIADLGETVAVVWDNLDRLPHHLVEVAGFDHGLAPSPVLIEIRQAPSLRQSGAFVLAALVALAFALAMFRDRPSEHETGRFERAAPAAPNVRWGLVFVAVLVGMVAFCRGVGWYFDPMLQTDRTMTARPAARAPSRRAGGPARPTLPDPTREEIALLGSSNPANQLRAADTLLARTVTGDLMAAVESALERHPAPEIEARLVCLKSRFEGPEILEFLLARFPTARKDLGWDQKPEVTCVLDALVARTAEAPERIRAALMPAVYASDDNVRHKALRALRTIDLQIPALLVAEASTTGAPFQFQALDAVLALGAIRRNPDMVARAVREPSTSAVVKQALRTDPHANGARIVAQVWVERSVEKEFEFLAREREGQLHDVSAALLEIVLDPAEPEATRAVAAHHLELLADIGPLPDLRELSSTLGSGELKASVDATILMLEEQQKRGRKARMRALLP